VINHEVAYDTIVKSSSVGGGLQGFQAHPKKFGLLKIWAKVLKIRVKIASKVVWLQKMVPKVCTKTREDVFLEVTSKRGLHDLCGR